MAKFKDNNDKLTIQLNTRLAESSYNKLLKYQEQFKEKYKCYLTIPEIVRLAIDSLQEL